jgi:hypothetical protein
MILDSLSRSSYKNDDLFVRRSRFAWVPDRSLPERTQAISRSESITYYFHKDTILTINLCG